MKLYVTLVQIVSGLAEVHKFKLFCFMIFKHINRARSSTKANKLNLINYMKHALNQIFVNYLKLLSESSIVYPFQAIRSISKIPRSGK